MTKKESKEKKQTQTIIYDEEQHKYLITLFKGQSLADPENFDSNKLVMLRLGVQVVGRISDLSDKVMPEYKHLLDIVKTTDIDIEIVVKFLERKMDHNEVIKFFATLVDVYKIAKIGDKIGELEMDEVMFREFMEMLHHLLFKTVNNDAVF